MTTSILDTPIPNAYHQAGHAVQCVLLDTPFTCAGLDRVSDTEPTDPSDEIAIAGAGPAAEIAFLRTIGVAEEGPLEWAEFTRDEEDSDWSILAADPTLHEARDTFRLTVPELIRHSVLIAVERLLTDPEVWEYVEKVAAVLSSGPPITEQDIRTIRCL